MKKTLIDTQFFKISPQAITEALKTENGNLIVEGRLQTAETKNGNGRYYPREILEREVKNYIDGPVKENRALGELDHPDSSIINLKNVSHNIKFIKWDGDDVIGTIEILPTPSGNILTELFRNGITVGVSSRGMGSLQPNSNGVQEVQDDFELLCWDFVSTPSTPGAYVHPISEGLNSSNHLSTKYNDVNEIITEILCNNGQCPII
ncbi:MAG: primosomal protein [archaeon]|nr:primosomal protein [archaeon]